MRRLLALAAGLLSVQALALPPMPRDAFLQTAFCRSHHCTFSFREGRTWVYVGGNGELIALTRRSLDARDLRVLGFSVSRTRPDSRQFQAANREFLALQRTLIGTRGVPLSPACFQPTGDHQFLKLGDVTGTSKLSATPGVLACTRAPADGNFPAVMSALYRSDLLSDDPATDPHALPHRWYQPR